MQAQAEGLYWAPNIGVGFNTVQQTYYRIGLDIGYQLDENIYFGVGAYYAFGDHPSDDREIGGGPFIGYHLPIIEMLSLEFREDIDYVDERNPVLLDDGTYTYTPAYGLESATYAGVHLQFGRSFGVSGGYRLVVGNNTLVDGRSGAVLGLTIGI